MNNQPIRRYGYHRQGIIQRWVNIFLTPFRIAFEIALMLLGTSLLLITLCVVSLGTRPMNVPDLNESNVSYLSVVFDRAEQAQNESNDVFACGVDVAKRVGKGLTKPVKPVLNRVFKSNASMYTKLRWLPDTYWTEVERLTWTILVEDINGDGPCTMDFPDLEKLESTSTQ